MAKYSFIILHYITIDDTVECINSIEKNIKNDDYSIVVVDNFSPNNTGEKLKNMYEFNPKVNVILSDSNLGFAKGNNLGFIYAKNVLNSDFIIMINNDTLIEDSEFLSKIEKKYLEENFYVMGPDIISTQDNGHQNPQRVKILSIKDAKRFILKMRILLILNRCRVDGIIDSVYRKIKFRKVDKRKYSVQQENVVLHGCCLIFSKNYIEKFDGLFDKTFMYMEEDILYYICRVNNFKTIYCPELIIYHKEDSATNEVSKNSHEKNKFIYENCIESSKLLLQLMNKY